MFFFSFSLFAEIEAKEACDWLRAAGFPQYVQLFKGKYEAVNVKSSLRGNRLNTNNVSCASDCRFPVDVEQATLDHHFLDKDALDSLGR